MTFLCILVGVVCGMAGMLFGAVLAFDSVTRDIGRYGCFTWGGERYYCSRRPQ